MTEWEPATEAEAAMRDALRANDQQLYFRILARTDLLLPVSAQALAGQAPMGWGTWTTGGRTHVLAFTSAAAMRACLGENAGTSRRSAYAELAGGWPNHEWWLAVNPGLPIEGYLPAWFVSQLSRGDVRLPGRTMGARARLERAETVARARAAATGDAPEGPATGPQGRPPLGGAAPANSGPYPPADGAPRPAEPTAGVPRPAGGRSAPLTPGPPADRVEDRPGIPLRRPTERRDAARDTSSGQPTPPTNGRADAGAERTNHRSFFEPAGRGSASRDEAAGPGLRAVPPSRLGRGGQPFPRRRPLAEPVPEGPTQAFPVPAPAEEATRAFAVPAEEATRAFSLPAEEATRAFAVPGGETTQVLPPRRPTPAAEEATRDLRVPGPDPAGAYAGRRPEPDDEAPRDLPRRRPAPAAVDREPEPVEELPVSAAEPVSAPPAPRRGFTPIVIEGTVVESRDLAGTPDAPARPGAPDEASARPGPFGDEPSRRGPVAGNGSLFEPVASRSDVASGHAEPPDTRPGPTPSDGAPFAGRPAEPDLPEPVTPAEEPAGPAPEPPPVDFEPANEVEENLLDAAGAGSTDTFLSTLLLARVLLPVAADSVPGSRPGEPGFVWHTEELDGETFVVVYTSPERLAEHTDAAVETVRVKFVQLIRRWPDESWSFVVNPGTPVGAKLPGEQILGLANWAAEVGLGDDAGSEPEVPPAVEEPVTRPRFAAPDPARPTVMQKAVAPSQLAYYLERGYDRVSGFVHRANELAHLNTPAQLFAALGLGHPGSPFTPDAEEIYLLRWPAHRPSLYRIPYGGQNDAAMRAMEGWVIERPPFRGNGFAPGESSDVVAEFKVDSARLPHGAQLWRVGADGTERVVAILDTDALLWRQVGEK